MAQVQRFIEEKHKRIDWKRNMRDFNGTIQWFAHVQSGLQISTNSVLYRYCGPARSLCSWSATTCTMSMLCEHKTGKSLLELPSPNKSYYLRVLIALTRDLDCAKNNDVSSVDVFQFHPDAISANGP